MDINKFTCPPQASAQGSFSDNLVGLQLVSGGGLTQGNFEFTSSTSEKSNRTFYIGAFSDPINLDSLGIENISQSKTIVENNYKVYPNFDLSLITNFVLYGSMTKRLSTSVTIIISKFPAAIESTVFGINYTTGATAVNVVYNPSNDETSFELDVARIRNPFDIDFTTNSTKNMSMREIGVSKLRDFPVQYINYSLYLNGVGYDVTGLVPTTSNTSGFLKIYVKGDPFSGKTEIYDNLIIRPNDQTVSKVFNEELDEVENFLLNRNVTPIYTASFSVPKEADDGTYYTATQNLTWPKDGFWNLDIRTKSFTTYLENLNAIAENFDSYKTNMVSRFLVTGAFKDFDTIGQKVEKVLQIYGRSFDDTKKFIDALAFMNSVNYNTGNDIPSQLLKNLAQTLGWNTNISPITNDEFLKSVFGEKNYDASHFTGVATKQTPDELNYQYYRNIILNSAFLFKSKGTRKSIEVLMRLIGAPDALVDFNEYVYVADRRININEFHTKFAQISGGTYIQETPVLDPTNVFSIMGVQYTGYTSSYTIKDANVSRGDYPIDSEGFPQAPDDTEEYFFQKGSGWFEQTPKHRAPEIVNLTGSVFTGSNPDFQTQLSPYTYGQVYLDKFRQFPYSDLGYQLTRIPDNNKSWTDYETGLRSNLDSSFTARYNVSDERLVLNVKNIDLFLNPSQGLVYDVWYMSNQYNFPIPSQGMSYGYPTRCNPDPISIYPSRGSIGVDSTEINPKPQQKTFFEFAQTFWQNMINVRNRQYSTDGRSGGYPTLESLYWNYLQSENLIGIENNNFKYQNMMEYVQGLGDYWIRLVEQMIPATTIWNTGLKYENSIFHRQKYAWRRQAGCQLVAIPCKPCKTDGKIFPDDCPIQTFECSKYPWSNNPNVQSFEGILGNLVNNYLQSNGYTLNTCQANSIVSTWYVDVRIGGVLVTLSDFFNGSGFGLPGVSSPTNSQWENALPNALSYLSNYGYSYYFDSNGNVVVYNATCSVDRTGINFQLNVGVQFQILCS